MNIEELKLILNAISSLGEQGKEAFLWYMAANTIPSFLLWAGFIGLLFFVAKQVFKMVAVFSEVDSIDGQFRKWRDELSVGFCGGVLTKEEKALVIVRISELIASSKK